MHDMAGNLLARSVHDLSAAAWFGGFLMGAVGLNGATAQARDPKERTRLSSLGWMKWGPIQTIAFATHLLADAAIAWDNKERIKKQDDVAKDTIYKAVVTVVGAGVTLYSAALGKKVERMSEEGGEGATEPKPGASDKLKSAQKQLKVLQWIVPAFAGWVIVLGAKHGEMQRPTNVLKGLFTS
jgi:hypothetical protein